MNLYKIITFSLYSMLTVISSSVNTFADNNVKKKVVARAGKLPQVQLSVNPQNVKVQKTDVQPIQSTFVNQQNVKIQKTDVQPIQSTFVNQQNVKIQKTDIQPVQPTFVNSQDVKFKKMDLQQIPKPTLQKKTDLKQLQKFDNFGSQNNTTTNDKSDGTTWTVTLDTLGAKLSNTSGWKQTGANVYVGEFPADKSYVLLPDAITNNVNEAFVNWCTDNVVWKDCASYPFYKSHATNKTYYAHFVSNTVRQAADAMAYGLDRDCYSHPEARNIVWSQGDRGDCNGMTKGSWWVKRDSKEYKGSAKCSVTGGSYAVPGKPSDTEGENCWCKSDSSDNWIFGPSQFSDKSTCLHDCAMSCAQKVLKEPKEEFRSALDSYTINETNTWKITLDTKGGGKLKNSNGWEKIGTDLYTRQFTANDSFDLPDVVSNKDNVYLSNWCGMVKTGPNVSTHICTRKLDKNTMGDRAYHAVYNDQGEFDSGLKGKWYSFNGRCYFARLQNSLQGWQKDGMCYDMPKGTWWIKHENQKYDGTAKCSATEGRYAVSGTPSDTKGENCWCKTSVNWVFRTNSFQEGYNCADVCGINCAGGFIEYKKFRDALENK